MLAQNVVELLRTSFLNGLNGLTALTRAKPRNQASTPASSNVVLRPFHLHPAFPSRPLLPDLPALPLPTAQNRWHTPQPRRASSSLPLLTTFNHHPLFSLFCFASPLHTICVVWPNPLIFLAQPLPCACAYSRDQAALSLRGFAYSFARWMF